MQIGNRVRLTEDLFYLDLTKKGDEGLITDIDHDGGYDFLVMFNNGEEVYMYASELEVI